MKQVGSFFKTNVRILLTLLAICIGIAFLMLYKLGSLVDGLSMGEIRASTQIVGWQGIYDNPLYLPLKIVRSIVFSLSSDYGQTLTRLPNAFFGGLTVLIFTACVRMWHGQRTAIFAGLLFATSAWTLHTSRLASFDSMYLIVIPSLLLLHTVLQRYGNRLPILLACIVTYGLLLYIPGVVWLIAISLFSQRKTLRTLSKIFVSQKQRVSIIGAGFVWLPLLVSYLATNMPGLVTWLGLPNNFGSLSEVIKQFLAVPVHLFIRGPQYPDIWLEQAPVFDLFTLAMIVVGIYFYILHRKSSRSKSLAGYALAGVVLVGLGGPVGLSLLVPLLYIAAATGLTYLLHDWLKVFPANPLARNLGIGLVATAVVFSCTFNLRAYFVAWPHNTITQATFQYRR